MTEQSTDSDVRHTAFDWQFIAVRPDYVMEVRKSILDESDGPMLLHGLKGMHQQRIWTPRFKELRPDAALLEQRYERFPAV